MPAPGAQRVTIDGHSQALTNLDKVLYPATGTTKGEVIVTLHGRPDGGLGGEPAKFALIHTGEDNWLIHRMPLKTAASQTRPPSSPPPTASPMPVTAAAPPTGEPLEPMLATPASPSDFGREDQRAFDGDLDAALATSAAFGLEGVVAKRHGSRYLPGQRSDAWLKLKHQRTASVVIGGWRPGVGNRVGTIEPLLVGVLDGSMLRYAGRVGSGSTDAGLSQAQELLAALASDTSPFAEVSATDAKNVTWVRPELVGEVRFSGLSGSGRLRHPVVGLTAGAASR